MNAPPAAAHGPLTPARLHGLLLAATVLGILLPLMPWVALQAREGLPTWCNWRDAHPSVERFLAAHAGLDPERLAPALRALPWEPPRQRASLRYYFRYAEANAVLLALLLVLHRRVRRGLAASLAWLALPDHRRGRRVVFTWCAGILLLFLTKTPVGFWIPAGIGGWTYEGLGSALRSTPPAGLVAPPPPWKDALARALAPENARYLPGPGWLEGPAMLLHFADGEVLPASWELTDLAKPAYVFGAEGGAPARPDVFAAVVENALAWRRRGARFLVPGRLGYPNHRAYPWIDYTGYPPPGELRRITFWRVTVHVDEARRVSVVGAERTGGVDAG